MSRNPELFERAQRAIPVGSIHRSGPFARSAARPGIERAERLQGCGDADGQAYIDYVGSWGRRSPAMRTRQ